MMPFQWAADGSTDKQRDETQGQVVSHPTERWVGSRARGRMDAWEVSLPGDVRSSSRWWQVLVAAAIVLKVRHE